MDAAAAVTVPAEPVTTTPGPATYVPPIPRAPIKPAKSPGLALFLSLLMPGVGQLYNGQVPKAFTFFFAFAGCIWLASETEGMAALGVPFIVFYNLIDAWQSATRINNRLAGNPSLLDDVDDSNSPVWGGALVAIGVVFLLRNLGWISVAWIARWWPLLLIAAGVSLVLRSAKRPEAPGHVPD